MQSDGVTSVSGSDAGWPAVPPRPTKRNKVISAEAAVRLILNGDTVVTGGFVGSGCAEELALALERRFLETGLPRNGRWSTPRARATARLAGLTTLPVRAWSSG